jgi:glycosyltransferase involved in cell wall biosynthesis
MFKPNPVIRQDARVQLRIQEDEMVCGFIGAFLPWHGINDFIVEILKVELPDKLKFLMVGDGPEFEAARALVTEASQTQRYVFTGRVSHLAVAQVLNAMDIGILPNSNEYGSPVKLFESMATKQAS